MNKLEDLVSDFRAALDVALERTVLAVAYDLKKAGPYWSGQFEELWEIRAGKEAIQPNIAYASDFLASPMGRQITPIYAPPTTSLQGYTLGNRAQYRLIAMDVIPGQDSRYRYERPGRTAPQDWYSTYRNSRMRETINKTLTRTLMELS